MGITCRIRFQLLFHDEGATACGSSDDPQALALDVCVLCTKQNRGERAFENHTRAMHRYRAHSQIHCSSCAEEVGSVSTDVVIADFIYCKECENKRKLHPRHEFTANWDVGIFSAAFVDCRLQGSDGGIVRAHKAFLAGKSRVFKEMLTAGMSECLSAKLEVPDMTAQELRPLVNFLYTGTVNKRSLEKHAVALFKASVKYEMPRLKLICERFLESYPFTNVYGVVELAKRYNSEALQQAVLPYLFREEFVKNNSAAVVVKAFREASAFEGYKEYRKKQQRKIAYLMEISVHRIADCISLEISEEAKQTNHELTVGSFEEWDEGGSDADGVDELDLRC